MFKVLLLVFSLCSGQLWLLLWFVVYLSIGYYEIGKSKYFCGNLGPALGKLVSSSFDKKRMNPHSVLSPGLMYSIICIDENCEAIFFINIDIELDRDMK